MALPTLTHNTTHSGAWHGYPLFSLENIYRLTLRLRERFDWLDEYFKWVGVKVVFRIAV